MTKEQAERVESIRAAGCMPPTVRDLSGEDLENLLAALLEQPRQPVSTHADAALSFLRLVLLGWSDFTASRSSTNPAASAWVATITKRREAGARNTPSAVSAFGVSFCEATARACVLALVKLGR